MTRHFTQVGLFNIIQVLTGRGGQPFTHLFIGQDLVLQNAHFGQRFTARGTASRRHHGKHIPAGDGGEVGETGEALEGAGELLVVAVFAHFVFSLQGDVSGMKSE